MIYEIVEIDNFGRIENILKKTDKEIISFIPMTEENSDYQAYLKWAEE